MKSSQSWVRVAGAAAAMALSLTACGGGSDGSAGPVTKVESSDEPAATSDAPKEAEPTGTFVVTGASDLVGKLKEIVCVPVEGGILVTAAFGDSTTKGTLSVSSGPAPSDHERGDSLTVKDGPMYSRISADTLPYDLSDDGSKVTGSVVLADMQDIVKPDVKDRKQVTLRVDVDCGTA